MLYDFSVRLGDARSMAHLRGAEEARLRLQKKRAPKTVAAYGNPTTRLPTRLFVQPAIVSPNAMPAQSATQSNPSRSRPISWAP